MQRSRPGIRPAPVEFRDGALYSPGFGDIYHSVDGAIEETRHVFLSGNDLPRRWRDVAQFTIVETGFGCGLNFLATWEAHTQSGTDCRLHFVSVEKHPFTREDLAQALAAWPALGARSSQLLAAYPPLIDGFHRVRFESGRVTLTLLFGDAAEMLGELDARADAFYLDGFAPARNPDMWSTTLFEQLRRLAAPGATAATYSVASVVRAGLHDVGFITRKVPGFGRKRDMLTAQMPGKPHLPNRRKAIVVGGGIAGVSSAFALAEKGVDVELVERQQTVGGGGSFNPAAVVRPFLSLDTGIRNRFGIAAFDYAVQLYREINRRTSCDWRETGVLQLAKDAAHSDKLAKAIEMAQLPAHLVCAVDAGEATRLCGATVHENGLWFASAGYVDGNRLCDSLIAASLPSVTLQANVEVTAIVANGSTVQVGDASGRVIASADFVILANGIAAKLLFPGGAPWLRAIRGQVTGVAAVAPGLRAPVCRDGYFTPAMDGQHYVGATFDHARANEVITREDRLRNLQRAASILPGVIDAGSLVAQSDWAALRCASRDRLPVIGQIDDNLLCSIAMGSRGFSWAPLAGEVVACLIAGEPMPLERNVLRRLSPSRFEAMFTS